MQATRTELDYKAGLRLVYLTSVYPAPSTTFITNEVQGLRRRGNPIQVYSVWKPNLDDLPDTLMREANGVRYLLPACWQDVFGTLIRTLVRAPWKFSLTLIYALTRRNPGARGRLGMLFYFVEAMLLADDLRGDHLHVHHANAAAAVGMLAARYLRIPFSFTAHGSDILIEKNLLEDKLAQARFVVTVSEYNRRHLEKYHPGLNPSVSVVRTGVDLGRFTPGESRIGRKRVHILSVGRLHPVKGFKHLITAVAMLMGKDLDFECSIMGEGPERENLQDQIRDLGVEEHVRIRRAIGHEEMPEVFAGADIYVLSSLSEGLPVVLMEAMASGIPVVSTRITGIPELVEEGVSGLLVPPGDPAALAEAVAGLIADPIARHEMGRAGRIRVENHFNLETNLDNLNDLFRSELHDLLEVSPG